MIVFTILLNILCEKGLGVVSWMIVFVPFIFMTLITSILLFTFGLTPSRGRVGDYEVKYYEPERQPTSYNSDDGELLNSYYEEVDKKHYQKENEFDYDYDEDNENYKEIRNHSDRTSEEYNEDHN